MWGTFCAYTTFNSFCSCIDPFLRQDSLNLMSTYLPKDSSNGSSYQEGGGLYAIGLIHANHGRGKITDYLHTQLSGASNEVSAFVMRCVSNPRSPRGFTCNLPCDMNKCKSAVSLFCDASHGVWCLCAWFVLKSISS